MLRLNDVLHLEWKLDSKHNSCILEIFTKVDWKFIITADIIKQIKSLFDNGFEIHQKYFL